MGYGAGYGGGPYHWGGGGGGGQERATRTHIYILRLYPFAGGHNGVVWGGVGWGWWRSLRMYTSFMLRLCVCYGDHGGVCWGGVGWGWWRSLHMYTVIMSVLTALQLYRNDCSSGKNCMAPKDAFVPDCLTWLDWNSTKSFWALSKRSVLHFAWQAWWFAHRRTGIITRIYILY